MSHLDSSPLFLWYNIKYILSGKKAPINGQLHSIDHAGSFTQEENHCINHLVNFPESEIP